MPTIIALVLLVAMQATQPTTRPAFPDSWTGRWTGPAAFVSTAGKTMQFEMEIGIAPTTDPDRFTWEIVYIDKGKRQVRPYELVIKDAAAGKYVIDEKSSIMIDSYLVGDALYCQFQVQKSTITGSYRVAGDEMAVELVTVDSTQPTKSGGENNVPVVTTHPITGVQRATLRRAK